MPHGYIIFISGDADSNNYSNTSSVVNTTNPASPIVSTDTNFYGLPPPISTLPLHPSSTQQRQRSSWEYQNHWENDLLSGSLSSSSSSLPRIDLRVVYESWPSFSSDYSTLKEAIPLQSSGSTISDVEWYRRVGKSTILSIVHCIVEEDISAAYRYGSVLAPSGSAAPSSSSIMTSMPSSQGLRVVRAPTGISQNVGFCNFCRRKNHCNCRILVLWRLTGRLVHVLILDGDDNVALGQHILQCLEEAVRRGVVATQSQPVSGGSGNVPVSLGLHIVQKQEVVKSIEQSIMPDGLMLLASPLVLDEILRSVSKEVFPSEEKEKEKVFVNEAKTRTVYR